ncbi:MAG: cupin domain-containing protein [Phycisphaerales bacterium JB065]
MTPVASMVPQADGLRVLDVIGSICEMLLTGEDTNGAVTLARVWVPAGWENPPHIHWYEDEMFYVLDGEIEVSVAGQTTRLRSGESAHGPRRVVHSFANRTRDWARVLVTITPGGFERFFKAMHDANAAGAPSMDRIVELIDRHGMSVVSGGHDH